jgi:hypothetical protein
VNKRIFLSLSLIALVTIVFFNLRNAKKYELNQYDKEILNYFKEIALKSEYGQYEECVVKWTGPMKLYIHQCADYEQQTRYIIEVVDKINGITKNNFNLQIVENREESNSIIYLCDQDSTEKLEKGLFDDVNEDFSGFSMVWYDNYQIYKSRIFININYSLEWQKSTILEEITQSIGLMNDSNQYSKSIFYESQDENKIPNMEYSSLDSTLIKLLYDPQMKPGTREWEG